MFDVRSLLHRLTFANRKRFSLFSLTGRRELLLVTALGASACKNLQDDDDDEMMDNLFSPMPPTTFSGEGEMAPSGMTNVNIPVGSFSETVAGESRHLFGNNGENTITASGGDGDEYLVGMGGNDVLIGASGSQGLWGGEGDDILWGGLGVDNLRGGEGNDILVLIGADGSGYTNGDLIIQGADLADMRSGTVDLMTALGIDSSTLNDRDVDESDHEHGEIIDGGGGMNTLIVYGIADLTDETRATFLNIDKIKLNSEIIVTEDNLNILHGIEITGDGASNSEITIRTSAGGMISLSDLGDISGLKISAKDMAGTGENSSVTFTIDVDEMATADFSEVEIEGNVMLTSTEDFELDKMNDTFTVTVGSETFTFKTTGTSANNDVVLDTTANVAVESGARDSVMAMGNTTLTPNDSETTYDLDDYDGFKHFDGTGETRPFTITATDEANRITGGSGNDTVIYDGDIVINNNRVTHAGNADTLTSIETITVTGTAEIDVMASTTMAINLMDNAVQTIDLSAFTDLTDINIMAGNEDIFIFGSGSTITDAGVNNYNFSGGTIQFTDGADNVQVNGVGSGRTIDIGVDSVSDVVTFGNMATGTIDIDNFRTQDMIVLGSDTTGLSITAGRIMTSDLTINVDGIMADDSRVSVTDAQTGTHTISGNLADGITRVFQGTTLTINVNDSAYTIMNANNSFTISNGAITHTFMNVQTGAVYDEIVIMGSPTITLEGSGNGYTDIDAGANVTLNVGTGNDYNLEMLGFTNFDGSSVTADSRDLTITGTVGDNNLTGGAGDDTFTGVDGANTLNGGDGTDTASGYGDSFTLSSTANNISIDGDTLMSIETITLSEASDVDVGTLTDSNSFTIQGSGGADIFTFSATHTGDIRFVELGNMARLQFEGTGWSFDGSNLQAEEAHIVAMRAGGSFNIYTDRVLLPEQFRTASGAEFSEETFMDFSSLQNPFSYKPEGTMPNMTANVMDSEHDVADFSDETGPITADFSDTTPTINMINFEDYEGAIGTSANDTFTTHVSTPNHFSGKDGEDVFHISGGLHYIDGGDNSDTVNFADNIEDITLNLMTSEYEIAGMTGTIQNIETYNLGVGNNDLVTDIGGSYTAGDNVNFTLGGITIMGGIKDIDASGVTGTEAVTITTGSMGGDYKGGSGSATDTINFATGTYEIQAPNSGFDYKITNGGNTYNVGGIEHLSFSANDDIVNISADIAGEILLGSGADMVTISTAISGTIDLGAGADGVDVLTFNTGGSGDYMIRNFRDGDMINLDDFAMHKIEVSGGVVTVTALTGSGATEDFAPTALLTITTGGMATDNQVTNGRVFSTTGMIGTQDATLHTLDTLDDSVAIGGPDGTATIDILDLSGTTTSQTVNFEDQMAGVTAFVRTTLDGAIGGSSSDTFTIGTSSNGATLYFKGNNGADTYDIDTTGATITITDFDTNNDVIDLTNVYGGNVLIDNTRAGEIRIHSSMNVNDSFTINLENYTSGTINDGNISDRIMATSSEIYEPPSFDNPNITTENPGGVFDVYDYRGNDNIDVDLNEDNPMVAGVSIVDYEGVAYAMGITGTGTFTASINTSNFFRGFEQADQFHVLAGTTVAHRLEGKAGNDTFTIADGVATSVVTSEGREVTNTFTILGGDGDDKINISGGTGITANGEDGQDEFNISGGTSLILNAGSNDNNADIFNFTSGTVQDTIYTIENFDAGTEMSAEDKIDVTALFTGMATLTTNSSDDILISQSDTTYTFNIADFNINTDGHSIMGASVAPTTETVGGVMRQLHTFTDGGLLPSLDFASTGTMDFIDASGGSVTLNVNYDQNQATLHGSSAVSFTPSEIDGFYGSTGNDTFNLSGAPALIIDGKGGADTFNTGAGHANTMINGGAGADTFTFLSSGTTSGTYNGGMDNDTFNIGVGLMGTVTGGMGNDEFNISATVNNITLGDDAGDDTYNVAGGTGHNLTDSMGSNTFDIDGGSGTIDLTGATTSQTIDILGTAGTWGITLAVSTGEADTINFDGVQSDITIHNFGANDQLTFDNLGTVQTYFESVGGNAYHAIVYHGANGQNVFTIDINTDATLPSTATAENPIRFIASTAGSAITFSPELINYSAFDFIDASSLTGVTVNFRTSSGSISTSGASGSFSTDTIDGAIGGGGADTFTLGVGDTARGGGGDDTFYINGGESHTIDGGGNDDKVIVESGTISDFAVTSIEAIDLTGLTDATARLENGDIVVTHIFESNTKNFTIDGNTDFADTSMVTFSVIVSNGTGADVNNLRTWTPIIRDGIIYDHGATLTANYDVLDLSSVAEAITATIGTTNDILITGGTAFTANDYEGIRGGAGADNFTANGGRVYFDGGDGADSFTITAGDTININLADMDNLVDTIHFTSLDSSVTISDLGDEDMITGLVFHRIHGNDLYGATDAMGSDEMKVATINGGTLADSNISGTAYLLPRTTDSETISGTTLSIHTLEFATPNWQIADADISATASDSLTDILDGSALTVNDSLIVNFSGALQDEVAMGNFGVINNAMNVAMGTTALTNFNGAFGGAGGDTFYAGDGEAYFRGGDGADTLNISTTGSQVTFIDFEASDSIVINTSLTGYTWSQENNVITFEHATNSDFAITLGNSYQATTANINVAETPVNEMTSTDEEETLTGTSNNDTFTVAHAMTTITTGVGDDTISFTTNTAFANITDFSDTDIIDISLLPEKFWDVNNEGTLLVANNISGTGARPIATGITSTANINTRIIGEGIMEFTPPVHTPTMMAMETLTGTAGTDSFTIEHDSATLNIGTETGDDGADTINFTDRDGTNGTPAVSAVINGFDTSDVINIDSAVYDSYRTDNSDGTNTKIYASTDNTAPLGFVDGDETEVLLATLNNYMGSVTITGQTQTHIKALDFTTTMNNVDDSLQVLATGTGGDDIFTISHTGRFSIAMGEGSDTISITIINGDISVTDGFTSMDTIDLSRIENEVYINLIASSGFSLLASANADGTEANQIAFGQNIALATITGHAGTYATTTAENQMLTGDSTANRFTISHTGVTADGTDMGADTYVFTLADAGATIQNFGDDDTISINITDADSYRFEVDGMNTKIWVSTNNNNFVGQLETAQAGGMESETLLATLMGYSDTMNINVAGLTEQHALPTEAPPAPSPTASDLGLVANSVIKQHIYEWDVTETAGQFLHNSPTDGEFNILDLSRIDTARIFVNLSGVETTDLGGSTLGSGFEARAGRVEIYDGIDYTGPRTEAITQTIGTGVGELSFDGFIGTDGSDRFYAGDTSNYFAGGLADDHFFFTSGSANHRVFGENGNDYYRFSGTYTGTVTIRAYQANDIFAFNIGDDATFVLSANSAMVANMVATITYGEMSFQVISEGVAFTPEKFIGLTNATPMDLTSTMNTALMGGAGADTLTVEDSGIAVTSGDGADTINFTLMARSATITDLTAEDRIVFSGITEIDSYRIDGNEIHISTDEGATEELLLTATFTGDSYTAFSPDQITAFGVSTTHTKPILPRPTEMRMVGDAMQTHTLHKISPTETINSTTINDIAIVAGEDATTETTDILDARGFTNFNLSADSSLDMGNSQTPIAINFDSVARDLQVYNFADGATAVEVSSLASFSAYFQFFNTSGTTPAGSTTLSDLNNFNGAYGGLGADAFYASADNSNYFDGGGGVDTFYAGGGDADHVFIGGDGKVGMSGNGNNDRFFFSGGTGSHTALGNEGDDTLTITGGTGSHSFTSGNGEDALTLTISADTTGGSVDFTDFDASDTINIEGTDVTYTRTGDNINFSDGTNTYSVDVQTEASVMGIMGATGSFTLSSEGATANGTNAVDEFTINDETDSGDAERIYTINGGGGADTLTISTIDNMGTIDFTNFDSNDRIILDGYGLGSYTWSQENADAPVMFMNSHTNHSFVLNLGSSFTVTDNQITTEFPVRFDSSMAGDNDLWSLMTSVGRTYTIANDDYIIAWDDIATTNEVDTLAELRTAHTDGHFTITETMMDDNSFDLVLGFAETEIITLDRGDMATTSVSTDGTDGISFDEFLTAVGSMNLEFS